MYGVKMVATVVMGRKCVHIRYLHGPVPEQHYRYQAGKLASQSQRANARAGSHIRHNRFRFEATRRGCRSYCHTYFSGNGVPCTIFASRVYIYTAVLPATKSCVCKLYKENIMYMYIVTHKSITSLIIENDVQNMKKKRQIILRFIRVTYLRNFHHPLRMMYMNRLKRNKCLSCDDSSRSIYT